MILRVANDMFLQYGYKSVTMDDIARMAGVSKKTLYQFYADKNALVEATVIHFIDDMKRQTEEDGKASADAVEEIFKALLFVDHTFRKVNPVVVWDLQRFHPTVYRIFEHYKDGFMFNVVRDNLLRGIEQGLYRAELNVDIIARFRINSLMSGMSAQYTFPDQYDQKTVQRELLELYLHGIVSLKGLELINHYKQKFNHHI